MNIPNSTAPCMCYYFYSCYYNKSRRSYSPTLYSKHHMRTGYLNCLDVFHIFYLDIHVINRKNFKFLLLLPCGNWRLGLLVPPPLLFPRVVKPGGVEKFSAVAKVYILQNRLTKCWT